MCTLHAAAVTVHAEGKQRGCVGEYVSWPLPAPQIDLSTQARKYFPETVRTLRRKGPKLELLVMTGSAHGTPRAARVLIINELRPCAVGRR